MWVMAFGAISLFDSFMCFSFHNCARFVAIQAKQFPVAAVGRVVVVVAVLVVDFQELQVAVVELAGAAAAHPGEQFQCLGAVARLAFFRVFAGFEDDLLVERPA